MPTKLNFKIYQGSTFKEVIRWENSTKEYRPITNITKSAPMVVTSTSHGIPTGWRTKITSVVGMKEVNDSDNYLNITVSDANTLTFNDINSLGYTAYISGGVLEFNTPYNLSGVTARMDIREKVSSTTTIVTLTTENGKILIDNTLKTITLVLSATETAALTFSSAVYSLEIINASAEVIPLIYGTISLDKEITR